VVDLVQLYALAIAINLLFGREFIEVRVGVLAAILSAVWWLIRSNGKQLAAGQPKVFITWVLSQALQILRWKSQKQGAFVKNMRLLRK